MSDHEATISSGTDDDNTNTISVDSIQQDEVVFDNNNSIDNVDNSHYSVSVVPRNNILPVFDSLGSKQVSLLMLVKCFIFLNLVPSLIHPLNLLAATDAIEDDNVLYNVVVESEDVKAVSLLLYTEFSFHMIIVAFILYSTLLGIVATINDSK